MSKEIKQGVVGLKKYDMTVGGIVFMLYCLVGAGAFGIEEIIPASGPGMTILMLCAFPVIWALPISNLVAECASLLPSEGGVYVWVKEAFGEFWGFQIGWWTSVSAYLCNGVYVALVSGYVSQMIPMSSLTDQILKIGMILIFMMVNLMGIKEVGKVSTVLSLIILAAFALVAVVGFINWETNPVSPFMPEGYNIIDGLGNGICVTIWMYCGYECIAYMSGEIKNPQIIPKGLLITMPIIALSYVLPTLGGLASMPTGSWQNWSTNGGLSSEGIGYSSILTTHLGEVWGYIFLIVAIVAGCAIFNTYLAAGSRCFFVLADDHFCPPALTKISKKRGVPYVGIISLSIVTYIMSQSDFTTLVSLEVVFLLAMYIFVALSILKLRKKFPVEKRKEKGLYVIPGGKLVMLIFCILPIVISVVALYINGTDYLTTGLIALCTGPFAYYFFKRIYGGLSVDDPEDNPINPKTKMAVGDTLRLGIFVFIAGNMAFLGQFWLQWYEIDYGGWTPKDYDMFANSIPTVLECLQWGGLAFVVIGVTLILIGRKKDAPIPKKEMDINELMEKYVYEQKGEE